MNRTPTYPTEYHVWLRRWVTNEDAGSYFLLLKTLDEIPFTWSVPNDVNRENDGLDLRYRFRSETNISLKELGECTMFEMLLALAIRMNESFYDWDIPDQTSVYFWEMLDNLQLLDYTDSYISDWPGDSEVAIRHVCESLNRREYDTDGRNGGLFPVTGVTTDNQKTMELWYQMNQYMLFRE